MRLVGFVYFTYLVLFSGFSPVAPCLMPCVHLLVSLFSLSPPPFFTLLPCVHYFRATGVSPPGSCAFTVKILVIKVSKIPLDPPLKKGEESMAFQKKQG